MIISYKWLLEYLPKPLLVTELSKILTSIGLEVEVVELSETIPGSLEGLVIGEVLTCQKHPNADKLSITTVNIGNGEPLAIVCGAPNVAAGQKVVVATVGTTVHPTTGEPFLIKKAKIRGQESAGMICAEDEIGLGSSHAGIIILPDNAIVGTLANHYYQIPQADFAIHIGLTPNRADANSHIGVARDVCAYLAHHNKVQVSVKLPESNKHFQISDAKCNIQVHIHAPEACKRYAGMCINNIKVGASPAWLVNRLHTIGVRSINNIVDITNYVLHEYGQPLHAFDANKIGSKTINVQFLPVGTGFLGLDGNERKLQATDLMICDTTGAMAMGGVFGGLASGITNNTTNIFLESAYFDPTHIRKTSLHHGLRTDAAQHFEKGVDINNVIPALERAASLIIEIAGGDTCSGVDVYPIQLIPTSVTISYAYIQKLSGKAYTPADIKQILVALGFVIANDTIEELILQVPTNKPDVLQPADIVEEILRIDGLDNIDIPQRLNISLIKTIPTDRQQREQVAELLCGMGLQEIVTNSIVNSKYYPNRSDLVTMINSLSSELDVMRPSMTEGGLEVINYNCNRKSPNLTLFEFGNIYTINSNNQYLQEARLALWITGAIKTTNWEKNIQATSIYYLKGIINNLVAYSGIKNAGYVYHNNEVTLKWKNQVLAILQQLPTARLNEFEIKQNVYVAEIYWDTWVKAANAHKATYKEITKFPPVQRDLAIVLDTDVNYNKVMEATELLKIEALQSYDLFDIFESEKLGKGKKSFALNYVFQLQDRTLTDAETEQLMSQLTTAYKNKLNAIIRE